VLAGLLFFAYIFVTVGLSRPADFGYDAYAYWHLNLADPYSLPLGAHGFFAYSPAFALAVYPLTLVPWPLFIVIWWGILLAAIAYLGRTRTLVLLAVPFVALELFEGNIHVLLAAAIVLGFRYPQAWAFVLLTKPTAGVGLLWFAVRREWRELVAALGTTAAIVVVTFVIVPQLWLDWLGLLIANAGAPVTFPAIPIPLWLRLPVAAAVVVFGARRNAAWTVPLAAMLALPVLWITSLSMLIGCWPLLQRDRAARLGVTADASLPAQPNSLAPSSVG
jgi:hypothetical protein